MKILMGTLLCAVPISLWGNAHALLFSSLFLFTFIISILKNKIEYPLLLLALFQTTCYRGDFGYAPLLILPALGFSFFHFRPSTWKEFIPLLLVLCYNTMFLLEFKHTIPLQWLRTTLEAALYFSLCLKIPRSSFSINRHLILYLSGWVLIEYLIFNQMRPGGPLGSATAVGSCLALLISHNFLCNKKKALTDHILLFLGLTASILTETRAVLIVFAFISVWYPICKSNKSLAFLPKIIMVMLSGLFIWYLLPNDFSIKARFIDLIAGKLDDSTAWRLQAWKAAIDVRWQSPIWGVGLGNFKYYMENIPLYPALPHAHNIFLFLFAECGLIALMLFLIFIGYLLKGIYKSNLAKEKLGLFLCFIIVGSVDIIPLFPPCLFIGAYLASRLISFNTLAKRPDHVEF